MKQQFQLDEFPNSNFEMESSFWTGKLKLTKDGEPVERSKEKGKPFLIESSGNDIIKAYAKPAYPDLLPAIVLNGKKTFILERLSWYNYIIGGLPLILVFVGGALGGIIGALGTLINYQIFRQQGSLASIYFKVLAIIALSSLLYVGAVVLFSLAIS